MDIGDKVSSVCQRNPGNVRCYLQVGSVHVLCSVYNFLCESTNIPEQKAYLKR